MDTRIGEVCNSLDKFANSLLNGNTGGRTMVENWNWNHPPLSSYDLAQIVVTVSDRIKGYNIDSLDSFDGSKIILLESIPEKIELFEAHTFPYLFNGNGNQAINSFNALMLWINAIVDHVFGWQIITDRKMLPPQLSSRLKSIQSELNSIVPDKNELQEQIRLIKEAFEAAESLPTNLERLKEAQQKVNSYSTSSAEFLGKIDTFHKEAERISKVLKTQEDRAGMVVEQCEDVFRIATTKGLATSFESRATSLKWTLVYWVIGLLVALIAGGIIGGERFKILAKALENTKPEWGVIWMDFALSVIGLAAPIWFAWLATKQINQNFRLAEDYAFKASVAKAYEGYRKEAARLDAAFEARLFSSALTRLEEAPLRFVSDDYHASPWQEFFASAAFQDALKIVPDLKNQFVAILKEGVSNLTTKGKAKVASSVAEDEEV